MLIFHWVRIVVVENDDDECRGMFRNGAWHVVDIGDGDVTIMCLVTRLVPHINTSTALGIGRLFLKQYLFQHYLAESVLIVVYPN